MNVRNVVYLLLLSLAAASCRKTSSSSKVPQIALKSFGPAVVKVNYDTCFLVFSVKDGDADLGVDVTNKQGKFDIYVKDFRFDTGFAGYFFPEIDSKIKDPSKGLNGTVTFEFTPYILLPRTDSFHLVNGDTTHFEVYIRDQAGHESNHITTSQVVMVI